MMASISSSPPPIPPPVPVETHPNRAGGLRPPLQSRPPPDPSRLAPEDAYYPPSTARLRPPPTNYSGNLRTLNGNAATPASVAALRPPPAVPGSESSLSHRKVRGTSRRRRRKGAWKKLLWVKQSCMSSIFESRLSISLPGVCVNLVLCRSRQLHRHRDLP